MVKRIVNAMVIIMFCSGIIHGQYVSEDIYQRHVDSVNQELKTIETKVDLGNKALKASELYSSKAYELVDNTLSSLGIIITLIGVGLGAGITYFFNLFINRKKSALELKYQTYKDNVERLVKTEGETIDLKKSSKIYFVSKDHSDGLSRLQNVINKEFVNNQFLNRTFEEAINVVRQEGFGYKVMIIEDHELPSKDYNKEDEEWKKFNSDLKKLISEKIGLIIYGSKWMPDMGMKYLGFASKPYTFYTNLNNLIKFMWIDKIRVR